MSQAPAFFAYLANEVIDKMEKPVYVVVSMQTTEEGVTDNHVIRTYAISGLKRDYCERDVRNAVAELIIKEPQHLAKRLVRLCDGESAMQMVQDNLYNSTKTVLAAVVNELYDTQCTESDVAMAFHTLIDDARLQMVFEGMIRRLSPHAVVREFFDPNMPHTSILGRYCMTYRFDIQIIEPQYVSVKQTAT